MGDIITKVQKSRTVFCPRLTGILGALDRVAAGSTSGTLRTVIKLLSVLLTLITRPAESSDDES